MRTVSVKPPCSEGCGHPSKVSVRVRLYIRRGQYDYEYCMCDMCVEGLKWLLRDRAITASVKYFDHAKAG